MTGRRPTAERLIVIGLWALGVGFVVHGGTVPSPWYAAEPPPPYPWANVLRIAVLITAEAAGLDVLISSRRLPHALRVALGFVLMFGILHFDRMSKITDQPGWMYANGNFAGVGVLVFGIWSAALGIAFLRRRFRPPVRDAT